MGGSQLESFMQRPPPNDKKKFLHEIPEYRILVEQLAKRRVIRTQLIEKDYWLMHLLWGLKEQRFQFELKGGRSMMRIKS